MAIGYTGMVNGQANPTAAAGINLFGQTPQTSTNKMLFNNVWDQATQTPKRQAAAPTSSPSQPAAPAPTQTTQRVQPAASAGMWWKKPLTVYYNNGIGSLSPMKSGMRQVAPEGETKQNTATWQDRFAEDVKRAERPPQQGGTSQYSYIQLANMLDSNKAANFGMTDEQVVAAVNALKGSS